MGLRETVQLPVSEGLATWETIIPQAIYWQPDAPHLHSLHCAFADGSDSIRERTGLRTITCDGEKILLNGKEITLRGVNRHELHPQTGPALSDGHIIQDLALLKDLGANFVRGSHYQQDQRFLDLCDECGLMVWEEALGWQARDHHFTNPAFSTYTRSRCAKWCAPA